MNDSLWDIFKTSNIFEVISKFISSLYIMHSSVLVVSWVLLKLKPAVALFLPYLGVIVFGNKNLYSPSPSVSIFWIYVNDISISA